ncbi:MAG: hypothetical protein JXR48_10930 [Candidatus Delongbacteria bacterium]|nr:hypothetical protein [Candidatus Delongbacteria bacterium]MBN2835466.1 hypothetical protein [Candidatus Delongbacteria bacterium]
MERLILLNMSILWILKYIKAEEYRQVKKEELNGEQLLEEVPKEYIEKCKRRSYFST